MLNYKNENYWKQVLNVNNITINRDAFFINRFKNKKVLHVGCADGDIFYNNKEINLHIKLINNDIDVDGFDIRKDIIDKMKKEYPKNNFYSSLSPIKKKSYDVVLIPEVIEHIDNIRQFLDKMFSIDSNSFFITVPNCEGLFNNFQKDDKGNSIEFVHPEHYYWFSSYTLFNLVRNYISDMKNVDMFYLQNKSSVAIEIRKNDK